MSFHILHLLSPQLKVRTKLEQLHIEDAETGTVRTVPLEDISIIIAASPDFIISAGALRKLAQLNVPLLVCNEKFEPVSVNLPYFRPTNTEVLRSQVSWTQAWKEAMWQRIIAAKIYNQAEALQDDERTYNLLRSIAEKCLNPPPIQSLGSCSTASVTLSQRDAFRQWHASACESRAARIYWRSFLPKLDPCASRRQPRTRSGVNGMLDYGYAVLRSAVLRSLAAHGFIAAIGINHAAKAGSFALADDLIEPLRPWLDNCLRQHLGQGGAPGDMKAWAPQAAKILTEETRTKEGNVRLLNAIDRYVQSFQTATTTQTNLLLAIPMLSTT